MAEGRGLGVAALVALAILLTVAPGAASASPAMAGSAAVSGDSAKAEAPADAGAGAVAASPRPRARRASLPEARWGKAGDRALWSRTVMSALESHASALPRTIPRDIADWCPAYVTNDRRDRAAFWLGLVSTLARHESTFRPAAVGGGGRWYGLMQILPATARGYGCRAQSGAALKNGPDNLSCALRIMARTVTRDGVVSRNMRGVAADWGPFHSRDKRRDMAAWIRAQPYCAGLSRSLRPRARQMPDAVPQARPAAMRPPGKTDGAPPALTP